MMHARSVQKTCRAAAAVTLAVLAMLGSSCLRPASAQGDAGSATAPFRHVPVGSLLRCTSLQQPVRGPRPAPARRTARYFAPTSQAVFFAHAGDGCVWRAGTPARG